MHRNRFEPSKGFGRFKAALGFDVGTKRYNDPLAELPLEGTTQDDFLEWRDRLRARRLPRTINRLARAVSAGLRRRATGPGTR